MYSYTHTYTHTHIYTYTHTHTHRQTGRGIERQRDRERDRHTHKYIHTHTHTHTHTRSAHINVLNLGQHSTNPDSSRTSIRCSNCAQREMAPLKTVNKIRYYTHTASPLALCLRLCIMSHVWIVMRESEPVTYFDGSCQEWLIVNESCAGLCFISRRSLSLSLSLVSSLARVLACSLSLSKRKPSCRKDSSQSFLSASHYTFLECIMSWLIHTWNDAFIHSALTHDVTHSHMTWVTLHFLSAACFTCTCDITHKLCHTCARVMSPHTQLVRHVWMDGSCLLSHT